MGRLMRHRIEGWVLLTGIVWGCGARPDPSIVKNVFGPDNRTVIDDSTYPYSAVGRLDSGCTGTLVGKRLVLTAAHCVVDPAAGVVRSDLGYFRPNLLKGVSKTRSWIQSAWVGTLKPPEERGQDWALLLLEEAPGDSYPAWGIREIAFAQGLPVTVNLVGYSVDLAKGDSPSDHRGCYVHAVSGDRLLHDCDATSGVSGGPIYSMINDVAYIEAITVSEYRQGAPQSVTRDVWDREHSNVAISAGAFAPTAVKLIQQIDHGLSPPDQLTAKYLLNPNPKPAPVAPTPGGGAEPPCHAPKCLLPETVLRTNADEITSLATRMVRIAGDIRLNAGERYQDEGVDTVAAGIEAQALSMRTLGIRARGDDPGFEYVSFGDVLRLISVQISAFDDVVRQRTGIWYHHEVKFDHGVLAGLWRDLEGLILFQP